MYYPVNIKKFDIYDIYHNDTSNLVIVSPIENTKLIIKYNNMNFNTYTCSHNHTYIYHLPQKIEYDNQIQLTINNEVIETKVNKYPSFDHKIIFSTIVLNEDKYIIQWIKYHSIIGISNFIIYDNSNNNTLETLLSEFIKTNVVVLIKWNYPYQLKKSGISGQTTQQNHSIWAFQNSKYIGLFDIDEYINLKTENSIDTLLQNIIDINNIDISDIGSFRLLNKFFYNPNNLSTNNFDFLKIYNCDNITLNHQQKNFVIPKNVNIFSVHMIVEGKPMFTVSQDLLFFNHYYFLNKANRGKNKTNLTDNSIEYNANKIIQ